MDLGGNKQIQKVDGGVRRAEEARAAPLTGDEGAYTSQVFLDRRHTELMTAPTKAECSSWNLLAGKASALFYSTCLVEKEREAISEE